MQSDRGEGTSKESRRTNRAEDRQHTWGKGKRSKGQTGQEGESRESNWNRGKQGLKGEGKREAGKGEQQPGKRLPTAKGGKEGPGRETQGEGGRGCRGFRGGRQAQKHNPKPGPSTMWQALCNRLQEQWISTYGRGQKRRRVKGQGRGQEDRCKERRHEEGM